MIGVNTHFQVNEVRKCIILYHGIAAAMDHHFAAPNKLLVHDQQRLPNYTGRIIKRHGMEPSKQ